MKSITRLEVMRVRRPLPLPEVEPYIQHADDAAMIANAIIGKEAQEVMIVIFLTAKHKVVGYSEIARGGIDECAVSMDALFRAVLLSGTNRFVLAHNHPSGDPTPSPADVAISTRIMDACAILKVTCLDHIILGEASNSSLLALGLLNATKNGA